MRPPWRRFPQPGRMTPTPRSRDRFRLGVSTLTALVTAGSLTAVGWFAGTAAREQQAKQAHDDAARALADAQAARARAKYDAAVARQKSASFTRRVILRPRPHRTVVHTQYVQSATTPGHRRWRAPSPSPARQPARAGVPPARALRPRAAAPAAAPAGTLERVLTMPAETFGALGTYVYVATRDAAELARRAPADRGRAGRRGPHLQPVPRRLRPVARQRRGRPLGRGRPAARRGRRRRRRRGRRQRAAWSTRCWAVTSCRGATTATSAAWSTPASPSPSPHPTPRSWQLIGLADDAVRVPAGTALDLGATGKALRRRPGRGDPGRRAERQRAMVSVGGDLAVSRPDGDAVAGGGLRAPGRARARRSGSSAAASPRRAPGCAAGRRAGASYHHLLDPRTGAPVRRRLDHRDAVLGTTAVAANTASTAAIVLGDDAPAWLSDHGVTARLVAADGSVLRTGGWPADEERAA